MAWQHVDFHSTCFVVQLFNLVFWLLKPLYEVIVCQLTNDVQFLLETLRYHCGVELLVALNLLSYFVEILIARYVHTILERVKVPCRADLKHWLLERKLLHDAAFHWFLWLECGPLSLLLRLDISDILGWSPSYPWLAILDFNKTFNERYDISDVMVEVTRFTVGIWSRKRDFF